MTLGTFICKRRKYMRLTQEELAGRIKVSKSAVAKWETDAGLPDRDNLQKLSKELNVTVDDMYRIIDSKDLDSTRLEVNMTEDIIASLESYGYMVIRPSSKIYYANGNT